jgi:hypothetical protein
VVVEKALESVSFAQWFEKVRDLEMVEYEVILDPRYFLMVCANREKTWGRKNTTTAQD